ncbi:MAG: class I tRNA ligase family protein [Thermomicrobiales bacterium]
MFVGRTYTGLYDHLPANADVKHRVIPWEDVAADEGSGIVHIALGCGREDYGLSKEHDLQVIAPIGEPRPLYDGFGFLTGMYAHDVAGPVINDLRERGLLLYDHDYTHRYATCWRCKTDVVFRVVDEWYIAMDPLRERSEIARDVRWIPEFGLDRELDWLRNMDDWMISKKRYWGLALPIYECQECGNFEVIGSKEELKERAVSGWDEFEGNSPHRPWVDAVKIRCSKCDAKVSRIKDVGNPWLDAGAVPFSTMYYTEDRDKWREWFPADFITESFPASSELVLLDAGPERRHGRRSALRDLPRIRPVADEHGRDAQERRQLDPLRRGSRSHGLRRHALALQPAQPDREPELRLRARRRGPAAGDHPGSGTPTLSSSTTPPSTASTRPCRRTRSRWPSEHCSTAGSFPAPARDLRGPRRARRLRPGLRATRAIEYFAIEEFSNWYIRQPTPLLEDGSLFGTAAVAYQTALRGTRRSVTVADGAVHTIRRLRRCTREPRRCRGG